MNADIEFRPRWREELEAISSQGKLVFELGLGLGKKVYFPTEARWRAQAPAWAREQWPRYSQSCRLWCLNNHVAFSLVEDANFQEEK